MSTKAKHESFERLLEAAGELNRANQITGPQKLAEALNEAPQTVTNWGTRGVSSKGAALAQKTLGISAAYILEGIGSKWWRDHSVENVTPAPSMKGKVPLISWVAASGYCKAEDPYLSCDADHWLDCPVFHSDSTFALRVRGDSMTAPSGASRTYPEGCIIFVDPAKRSPINGDRVIACLEGTDEVTFKVYKNEDGRQWLMPLNPLHEPLREPFKIIGVILGKWEDG